jgi:hypothetical protein
MERSDTTDNGNRSTRYRRSVSVTLQCVAQSRQQARRGEVAARNHQFKLISLS